MPENKQTVGLVGVGRMGLPFAASLIDAGYEVVCCERGRSAELVEKGGAIAGDGSPRAVAEAADVVLTCLPNDAALEQVLAGDDGVLAAEGEAPLVVELSTVSIPLMESLQERIAAGGGDLLDCPVSGTPPMAEAKEAVIFASGDRGSYEKASELIAAMAPKNVFVGPIGAGTNFKYVANLLAFVHVTAAAEAMAFASAAGLDLNMVAGVISKSPGATSGQFNIRAPMIAEGNFGNALVTVEMMREVCDQICARADEVGASTPLIEVVRDLYAEFAAQGDADSDPGKLSVYLRDRAG